ncbi:hypothetical protein CDEF62S_03569 [Castellaniella defragrans]
MATNREGRGGVSGWLVRGLSRLLVLALAFVAGAVVMHVGMHAGDHEHMQALQAQNTDLQTQLTKAQASLTSLQNQTGVQGGTQRALQDKVTELQQALGSTRDQLSFYEQLLPAGPAGTVAIRAFNVQPKGDFLQYRVLLTRSVPDQSAPFGGRLRFVATGRQDGKTVKVELSSPKATADPGTEAGSSGVGSSEADSSSVGRSVAGSLDTGSSSSGSSGAGASSASPSSDTSSSTNGAKAGAAASAAADPLALSFDQYQRSTGVLQSVPGLTIQSIRVDVLEGDTVRASQDTALDHSAGSEGAPR